jgi:hypothetical protein
MEILCLYLVELLDNRTPLFQQRVQWQVCKTGRGERGTKPLGAANGSTARFEVGKRSDNNNLNSFGFEIFGEIGYGDFPFGKRESLSGCKRSK